MRTEIQLAVFVICLMIPNIKSERRGCYISEDKIICAIFNLTTSEPIQYEQLKQHENEIKHLQLSFNYGSLGTETLSIFSEVEYLHYVFNNITYIEKGALCSLPKLKNLILDYNEFPKLTREHFSGCNHLEELYLGLPLDENALEELTGLKTLQVTLPFKKAYIAPLRELTFLDIAEGTIEKIEPGLFCVPSLEKLKVDYYFQPLEVTESLFDGCDNLKYIFLQLNHGVIPPGSNPFSNLTRLEHLGLADMDITNLTKDFLVGTPNLKEFYINGFMRDTKLHINGDIFINAHKLRELGLIGVQLEDSDLETLYLPTNLEQLDLRNNKLTNIGLLRSLPKLKELRLKNNKIVKFDLAALKKNYPNLEKISVQLNPLDSAFLEELKEEKSLEVNLTIVKYYREQSGQLVTQIDFT